jgi:hypothetical protein
MSNAAPRISIHESTYHGKNGFTVRAGRGQNIFCTTREMAEQYRDMLQEGLEQKEEWRRSHEILCGEPSGYGPSAAWLAAHPVE